MAAAMLSLQPRLKDGDAPDTATWGRFTSFSYNGKTATTPWDEVNSSFQ